MRSPPFFYTISALILLLFIYLLYTQDDDLYGNGSTGFFNSKGSRESRHSSANKKAKKQQRNKDVKYFQLIDEVMKVGHLAQNDSRILQYILSHGFLRSPPSPDLPYNLVEADSDPSIGQSTIVRHALSDMKNGFFVEAGALDGELRSNTLLLEKKFGWKGLLIEPDPKNYEKLLKKNRRAWSSNTCLAIKPYPHEVIFRQNFNTGKISEKTYSRGEPLPPGLVRVQCFPWFSLMAALNITVVDYFSLDVEGSELDILSTIPFDSIFIKVLSVEYIHDKGGKSAVKKYLNSKGFRVFGEVVDPRNYANDYIFINNALGPHFNHNLNYTPNPGI